MNESTTDAYAERFGKVFDYIEQHLEGDLSVERLSRVANFSKSHFHRQFSEYAGISVARYVQLMRLKRASYRLVFNVQARIVDIALEAGFETPESFARAFKHAFGQTPSQFRNQPEWQAWGERYRRPKRKRMRRMEVKVVEFEQTPVGVLEHRGPMERVNESALLFTAWRNASGLSPVKTSRSFGIVYDNPETTEPERFRFDICGEVSAPIPENVQGVVNKLIPGGRCAVVRHRGSYDRLGESIYPLYRDWLPQSGEDLRDFPLFFHYSNLMPETPEHELVTDIYLPLE